MAFDQKEVEFGEGFDVFRSLEKLWIEAQEHHLQRHGSLAGGALLYPLTSASFSAIRKIAEANTLGVFCMTWLQCLATLAHESCNANSRKPEERKAAENAFNVAGTLYGSLLVGMLADYYSYAKVEKDAQDGDQQNPCSLEKSSVVDCTGAKSFRERRNVGSSWGREFHPNGIGSDTATSSIFCGQRHSSSGCM